TSTTSARTSGHFSPPSNRASRSSRTLSSATTPLLRATWSTNPASGATSPSLGTPPPAPSSLRSGDFAPARRWQAAILHGFAEAVLQGGPSFGATKKTSFRAEPPGIFLRAVFCAPGCAAENFPSSRVVRAMKSLFTFSATTSTPPSSPLPPQPKPLPAKPAPKTRSTNTYRSQTAANHPSAADCLSKWPDPPDPSGAATPQIQLRQNPAVQPSPQ